VLEEREGTEGDRVDGGLVAGHQQDQRDHDHLVVVEVALLHLACDQLVQQAVLGLGLLLPDQAVQIGVELAEGRVGLRRRRCAHEIAGALLEEAVVAVRDAEELADRHGGHGQREGRHQVRDRSLRQHVVQEPVDEALKPGTDGVHALDAEAGDQHAPLPGVQGVVDADQRERELSAVLGAPDDDGEFRVAPIGGQPGIDEQGPSLGMPGDQPRRPAVEQRDPRQRALVPP
jgi:hypothetical protein